MRANLRGKPFHSSGNIFNKPNLAVAMSQLMRKAEQGKDEGEDDEEDEGERKKRGKKRVRERMKIKDHPPYELNLPFHMID